MKQSTYITWPAKNLECREKVQIFPILFFAAWISAQLSIFWFGLFRVLPIVMFILFTITYVINFTNKVTVRPLLKPIAIYLSIYFAMGVSCYWSPSPIESLEFFLNTIASSLPALFAGEYLARRYSIASIILSFHLIPILVFPQFFYNFLTFDDWAIFDIFSMRTVIGAIICMATPAIFGYALYKKNIISFIFAIISGFLLILIQSRTGILGAAIGCLIIYIIFNARNAMFWIVFSAPFLLLFAVVNQSGYLERFSGESTSFDVGSDVISELVLDRSLTVDLDRRLHTFIATEMIFQNPVFGGGYYSIYLNNKFEFGLDLPAHGFIGTFAEIGMLPFLIFLLFLYNIYGSYRTYIAVGDGSFSQNVYDYILIVVLLMALFTGLFHQAFESPNFSLVTGLILGRLAQLRFHQLNQPPPAGLRNKIRASRFY